MIHRDDSVVTKKTLMRMDNQKMSRGLRMRMDANRDILGMPVHRHHLIAMKRALMRLGRECFLSLVI